MAFNVTPTSGAGPYVFSATFANDDNYDPLVFAVEFRQTTNVGSCIPETTSGVSNAIAAESLFFSGTYTSVSGDVPPGSCRTYTLLIRRLVDNEIESIMSVTVSNV